MKNKFIIAGCAILLSATAGTAYAQTGTTTLQGNVQANMNGNENGQATVTASTTIRGNATSSAASEKATSTRGNATSSTAQNKKASTTSDVKHTAKSHGSVVSAFVKSLHAVADRNGGIGSQVRVVAQSQNDSGTTTVKAMTKLENRGSFRSFLFGDDNKSLAIIRSEIATTTANISRLQVLLDQVSNDADRAELELQISALQVELVKLNAYLKAYEGGFSLFGWLKNLFVR